MPAPPYSTGTEMPSSPRPAICGRMPLVEAVLAIERLDARRDLAAGPLLHRLLQQAVFLGEIEVDHGAEPIRLSGHLDRRAGLDAIAAERRRRARRDFEHAGAAEERRHFPVADLGVGADQPQRSGRRASAAPARRRRTPRRRPGRSTSRRCRSDPPRSARRAGCRRRRAGAAGRGGRDPSPAGRARRAARRAAARRLPARTDRGLRRSG